VNREVIILIALAGTLGLSQCTSSNNKDKESEKDKTTQDSLEIYRQRFELFKAFEDNLYDNALLKTRDTTDLTNKIIGGDEVQSPSEIPWQVALIRSDSDPFYGQFCGGSLIHNNWVLTAAHCLKNRDVNSLRVMTGSIDLDNPGQLSNIKRIIIHPNYNPNNYDNDIALLELSNPVALNQYCNIIQLPINDPREELLTPGTTVSVSGWGRMQNGYDAVILNRLEIPLVSDAACINSYGPYCTINMVCAGFKQGGRDACKGDSGGPLFIEGPNQESTLVGIVSWGWGCAQPDLYGVYTKVHNYLGWVERECRCITTS
jgi:secreted trypsin-like serine protease